MALVALPLSIAIAIASGAAPAAGLVTAVVAGFLISALGGSRVQIGGPTGAFIVVVYGIIHAHGFDGLLLATLMAGVILAVAGVLRAGRLVSLVPETVIEGFTIGIAIVIAESQVKDLLRMKGPALPADFWPKINALWAMRHSVAAGATAVGLGSVAAILALRRIAPKMPWLVVVMALASIAAAAGLVSVDTVAMRYGDLPRGLPAPTLPPITTELVTELLPSALTIALLAGIESLLSAIVADRMIGAQHRSNAELLTQGAANIAAPLFGVPLSPQTLVVPVVAAVSILCLIVLGILRARVGGAPVTRSVMRMTFWGILAMALTAGIGSVVGTAV